MVEMPQILQEVIIVLLPGGDQTFNFSLEALEASVTYDI